jgi:hypothetical protein
MSDYMENLSHDSLYSSQDLDKDWTQVKPEPTYLVTAYVSSEGWANNYKN